MPSFPFIAFPPSGIDRADGTFSDPFGTPIGTKTPPGAVMTRSSLAVAGTQFTFEEAPDSPVIERGEQGTITHKFRVDGATGITLLQGLGRGRYLTDSYGNTTRILTSRLTWGKANQCTLELTCESISFDSPPDEFNLEVIENNPALEVHPRYAFLPADIRNQIRSVVDAAQQVSQQQALKLVRSYFQFDNASLFPDPPPPPNGALNWTVVQHAVDELLLKRRIGEDTFYLPGFRVIWSQFFFIPPKLNPGGYIGDPIVEGLPYFFWSTTGDPDGPSIFSYMASINKQFYDQGISWLRLCDTLVYQRTWFKLTRSWIGAPYHHWDSQVYSQDKSPYPPPPEIPKS